MNNQKSKTIRELRDIVKQKEMIGYYKLRKADLITAINKRGGGVIDNDEKKNKINFLDTSAHEIKYLGLKIKCIYIYKNELSRK